MATNYNYGDDLVAFAKAESDGYGIPILPVAADAYRARSVDLAPAGYDRTDPGDRKGTFSVLERIEGRRWATWRATVLHRPSGALGTAPDIWELLTMAFGTQTINASTSVVYTQLKDRSSISASLWMMLGTMLQGVRGAICQTLTIRWSGADFIVFEFAGIAKEFIQAWPTTANGTGTSTTTLVLADADFVSDYAVVQIGGSGGAKIITTVASFGTETTTLQTAASWSNGAAVDPYLPTGTLGGDPIYGTKGSISLDGGSTTIAALSGEVTINTGLGLLNREYGSATPSAVVSEGKWSVKGSLVLAIKKTDGYLLSHARRQVQKDFRIILGDTSAKRAQIDMDVVEIDPSGMTIPDTGIVEAPLQFEALGASAGENNLSMTYA